MSLLSWLEDNPLSQFILEDAFAHPILLCIHAVGMAIVVGLVLMFDLRVVGYPKTLPLTAFKNLTKLGWTGFALNALSGLVLFATRASSLPFNLAFQLKIGLILFGGLSMWFLGRTAHAAVAANDDTAEFPLSTKLLAVLTALVWIGAIIAGRYIGYTLAPRISIDG